MTADRSYTIGSLCTGYGGLDLAVEAVFGPADHLWHAEYDPERDPENALYKEGEGTDPYWKVPALHAHWPTVPNLGDIARIDWENIPIPDIVTCGFSCKDISAAGRQAGLGAGTRSGVWGNIAHGVSVLRRRAIDSGHGGPLLIIENVRALLSTPARRSFDASTTNSGMEPGTPVVGDGSGRPILRAIGAVLGDLADLGFDAQWVTVPASAVGAPHLRERVFVLAWPTGSGRVDRWRERADQRPAWFVTHGDGEELTLLPTLVARDGDGRGEGSAEYWDRKRATGWNKGLPLGATVSLMRTPVAVHGWGPYDAAIRRWERTTGRAAPEPVEIGAKGGPRLSPRFGEWMMGLPEGWVSDHLGRKPALWALGDGVVWRQAAHALRLLLAAAG
jgi:DNA (cytosine-5)-methyltransferase 1